VLNKLEMLSEENGILMKRVDPSYTSQTCHHCKKVEKSNRNGENYSCDCGYTNHADINAALNIKTRGENMVPLDPKLNFTVFH
jgi:transposase